MKSDEIKKVTGDKDTDALLHDEQINQQKKTTCCLCKKNEFDVRHGNNAQPIEDGICCNECNQTIVVPVRMLQLFGEKIDRIDAFAKEQVNIIQNKEKALNTDDYKKLVQLSSDALQVAKESEVVLKQLLKKKGD